MGTDTQNPTPTTTPATPAPDFSAIPGHQEETMQAAPKSVYQAGPSGVAHGKAGSMGSAAPEKSFVGENIDKLTEPIENYTPAGRTEHPILSRLGDVTRGVKELLEGGQAAGKPMGTSSGVANNPVTGVLLPEDQALIEGEGGMAEQAAKAEELARKYVPQAAGRVAEAGHTFLTGLLEEGKNYLEAQHPEGSLEAGFAKIPGHRSEGPTPRTVNYLHNTAKAPYVGEQFGQHVEPAGKYVTEDEPGSFLPKGWERGTAQFKKPLVMDFGGGYQDPTNWKHVLSEKYDGKTGLALSKAIMADGYDGVITKEGNQTREIVDFGSLKNAKKPAKLKPPVEVNPDAEATKKAEADLAAARANYVHDMEKNPTTFPKGTPVHEQVVYVDPNKVIAKVNPGGNTFDESTVQKYQRMIRNGEDIPAARIEYGKTGDVRGYDGRHRIEAARREGAPVKLWTRREVEPGEAPPTTIGHEEPQVHELNGDEVAPNHEVAESAQRYNAGKGQEEIDHAPVPLPATEERARLADAYDTAQHNPNDPEVQRAYQAFKNETLDQFNHAKNDLGIKFDFTHEDPYKSAAEMQADLRNNHHLSVFTGGEVPADHPMAEIEPSTGQPYNNVFRATHDIFGHAAGGHDFTEAGEHAAYGAHSQMYSPEAQPAMRTETQGQSNWFFNNKGVREGAAPGVFPEQKAAILPDRDENAYHPDLQAVADKYGTSEDPHKVGNGASFIAPDGKYIHLGSTQHPEAIEKATGERAAEDMKAVGENMQRSNGPEDSRVRFLADTGAIRTRATFGRAGHTLHISVPEKGVTPDQVDALKGAARAALGSGKSGNIVMEIGVPGGKSATAEFANANNIEPMLKEIGAHPDKTPTEAPHWTETASQQGEKNGGFTVNPRTGAIPQSGHILEAVPEMRQVSDKPNTPAQIQKFADSKPVKKLLAKYPELQIGGYKNDAGKYELNLSAVTNDSSKAEKVAKALDQESYYNASEGKIVPTGGKNTQQKFPDYTIAQRLRDLAPEEPGMTISTRQPSSVKYSTEDPLRHNLRLTDDLINKNPALADKWAEAVKSYPGFQAPEGADTPTVLNAFIEHAKDNLKHLYNSLPPEEQEKNKVWYDGAHQLTKDLADQHGLTHPQTAGIVASLSPQKDWDQNVSLARRLTSIMKNQQNTKAGPDMLAKAKDIKDASWTKQNPQANDYLVSLAKKIQGKTLGELKDPMQKAAFVRLHDEVNNPREYFKINPDGSNAGVYTKADGTKGKVAWGTLDEIGKGISMFEDGSRDNLSANLGQAHKVRHFYNNIIEPNSARGDVTVDTHAVAAALMRALGGKNPEVLTNFGGPGSNIHGLNGTYPLYHEAYTRAAKELDIAHPRQLQSVVWEHIRNLFPAEFKTKENQAAIDGIWKEAQNGQITAEDARNKITQYAKEHRVGSDETEQHPADQSELFGNSVHGESARGRGRGDRGVNPVGNQETRPAEVKYDAYGHLGDGQSVTLPIGKADADAVEHHRAMLLPNGKTYIAQVPEHRDIPAAILDNDDNIRIAAHDAFQISARPTPEQRQEMVRLAGGERIHWDLNDGGVRGNSGSGSSGEFQRALDTYYGLESKPAESSQKAGSGWLKMMQSASPKKNEFLK